MSDRSNDIAELIPAATVICLRDGNAGIEALLLRRNRDLRSFGGAWVFPGGRVDESDAPGEMEIERAKETAIREAREETGLDLSQSTLVPLSQWIPPIQEKRRFSTWFFVTAIEDQNINIDGGEIHDFKWVCPGQTVSAAPDPDTLIMPPTFVSLFQLKEFGSTSAALDGIARRDNDLFQTKFDRTDAGFVTYWREDVAFETGNLSLDGARHRLEALSSGWRYLRNF